MISKPAVAKFWYTVNKNELSKQLGTTPGREIVAVLVTGGGGAAALRVYNSADGVNESSPSKDSFLVAANGGESFALTPNQPIPMNKGLYIELEQGGASNGEGTIFYN